MRTEPLTIWGLAGPVMLESGFLASRVNITVGGHPATRVRRNTYALPAVNGGMVEARVSGGFLDAYPTLEINGVKHRTGPAVPVLLRILALVPIFLIGVGGALGGVIGAVGVALNMAIARLVLPSAVKALLMAGVLIVAAVTWYAAARALLGAMNG